MQYCVVIKCIILSTVLSLLSACAEPQFANVAMRSSAIHSNEKCMIVAKVKVPYTDLFNKSGNYNGYLHLSSFQGPDKKKKIYQVNGSSYINSATMINPGKYYIDSISWNDGLYIYKIKISAKALDIKPGQCNYIGDLTIVRNHKGTQVLVKDNLPHAVSSIENSKLDSLANRLHFTPFWQGELIVKPEKAEGN